MLAAQLRGVGLASQQLERRLAALESNHALASTNRAA
jgi:hypothetical protein